MTSADYATAVLSNGPGRHDAARDAAARLFEQDVIGYRTLAAAELAEAAPACTLVGRHALRRAADSRPASSGRLAS